MNNSVGSGGITPSKRRRNARKFVAVAIARCTAIITSRRCSWTCHTTARDPRFADPSPRAERIISTAILRHRRFATANKNLKGGASCADIWMGS